MRERNERRERSERSERSDRSERSERSERSDRSLTLHVGVVLAIHHLGMSPAVMTSWVMRNGWTTRSGYPQCFSYVFSIPSVTSF